MATLWTVTTKHYDIDEIGGINTELEQTHWGIVDKQDKHKMNWHQQESCKETVVPAELPGCP